MILNTSLHDQWFGVGFWMKEEMETFDIAPYPHSLQQLNRHVRRFPAMPALKKILLLLPANNSHPKVV